MNHTAHIEFGTFFKNVGSPTAETRGIVKERQQNVESMRNPHSFALTLDVRPHPRPTITWSHNTDLHFGFERLGFEDYFGLIHPKWVDIYTAFAAAAYAIGCEQKEVLRHQDVCYTLLVPLLNIDGKYYWYRQVSMPCMFDRHDNMVAHLNHYHRAAEYGHLRPEHPIITIADRRKYKAEAVLRRRSHQVLSRIFYNRLTKRERGVLYCFRRLQKENSTEVSNQQVGRVMKLALGTINKNNTRILTKAKEVFPLNTFNTMSELATLLNVLFGMPQRQA